MPSRGTRGLEKLIEDLLDLKVLKGVGRSKAKARISQHQGATFAEALEVDVQMRFFVKRDDNPATLRRERQGYALLAGIEMDEAGQEPRDFARFLVPPLLNAEALPIMLFPMLDTYKTFDAWVAEGDVSDDRKVRFYIEILEKLWKELWNKTQAPAVPEFGLIYRKRIEDRLRDLSRFLDSDASQLILDLNGKRIDLSAVLADYEQAVADLTAPWRCTIHGDEHPKNIMVHPDTPRDWKLIDYGSVREKADWVYSVAKLLHWWRAYLPIERVWTDPKAQAKLDSVARWHKPRGQRPQLELSFNAEAHAAIRPRVAGRLASGVMRTARAVAEEWEDETWLQRLRVAYFAVVFGGLAVDRHLQNKKRFSLAAPPMIADALTVFENPDQLLATD